MSDLTWVARPLGTAQNSGQAYIDGSCLYFVGGNMLESASVPLDDSTLFAAQTDARALLAVPVTTYITACFYLGDRTYAVGLIHDFAFPGNNPAAFGRVRVNEDASLTMLEKVVLTGYWSRDLTFWYDRENQIMRGQVFNGSSYFSTKIPMTSAAFGAPTYAPVTALFNRTVGLRDADSNFVGIPTASQLVRIYDSAGTSYVNATVTGDAAGSYSNKLYEYGGIEVSAGGPTVDPASHWFSPVGEIITANYSHGYTSSGFRLPTKMTLSGTSVVASIIPPLDPDPEWSVIGPQYYAGYCSEGYTRARVGQKEKTTTYSTLVEAYEAMYTSLAPTYEEFLVLLEGYGYDTSDEAALLLQIGTAVEITYIIAIETEENGIRYGRSAPGSFYDWRNFRGQTRSGAFLVEDSAGQINILEVPEPEVPVITAKRDSVRRRFVRAG